MVTVFEKDQTLGGKLKTVELCDTQVEAGADSFLVRDRTARDLAVAIGLEQELVEPAIFGGLVWDGKSALPMPKGTVMGLPVSAATVRRAENISLPGKVRALADLLLPGELEEEDVAVGPYLRKRLGTEWTRQMVDPILAGTRSGDIEKMSLRYALPQVFEGAKKRASVIRTLSKGPGGAAPVFNTPVSGMSSLVQRIAAAAKLEIRRGTAVRSIATSKEGWTVVTDGAPVESFDAVILALPLHQAAPLLENNLSGAPGAERVIGHLKSMPHASVASVALAYRSADIRWPEGSSGFLVPSASQRTLAAGTWWSAKWPHTQTGDMAVVRCFVGRSGRHPALDLDDKQLALRAGAEIAELTGAAKPIDSRVDRWEEGLPQFEVGHHRRLEAIAAAQAATPGLVLAGPDLTGSGIPDCISRARDAAAQTLSYLQRRPRRAV